MQAKWIWLILASLAQAQNRPQRQFELKAESEDFWKLVDHAAKLEKLAGGFKFTEGPVWDPHGFLYFSDEAGNRLHRLFPDGRTELVLEVGDPDGNTLDAKHQLITCSSVLRAVLEVKPDGSYRILANKYDSKKLNTPNDVVLGPDSALYFTDPTLDLKKDQPQENQFQGVYRLGEDGSVRLLTRDLAQPNGLAFSPDGRRLYIDDSERREIRVYDFGPNAELSNSRLFGTEAGPPKSGVPDGMRVDRQGNLFVTGPLGIWVWDSSGRHLGTIVMPEQPANLAWGGPDYQTLYITATTSVYRLKTRTRGFVPYEAPQR